MEQSSLPFAEHDSTSSIAPPAGTELAQRRRRALAALKVSNNAGAALHAMHGDSLQTPADDMVALVHQVLAALPAKTRGPILARLTKVTSQQAGHMFMRALAGFQQLGELLDPHCGRLASLLEKAEREPAARILVTVRDCYGDTHRVSKDDLESSRALLRRYHVDGTPVGGRQTHLHRDNIDPNGDKAATAWKDIPYFAAKGDKPFASAASARVAIRRRGQAPEDYEIKDVPGGVIAVLRARSAAPSTALPESPA